MADNDTIDIPQDVLDKIRETAKRVNTCPPSAAAVADMLERIEHAPLTVKAPLMQWLRQSPVGKWFVIDLSSNVDIASLGISKIARDLIKRNFSVLEYKVSSEIVKSGGGLLEKMLAGNCGFMREAKGILGDHFSETVVKG